MVQICMPYTLYPIKQAYALSAKFYKIYEWFMKTLREGFQKVYEYLTLL